MSRIPSAEQINKILAKWESKGRIIEGAWMAYVATSYLKTAPDFQKKEMREAWMFGAYTLYASLMSVINGKREPAKKDLRRMASIHKEMDAFLLSLEPEKEGGHV